LILPGRSVIAYQVFELLPGRSVIAYQVFEFLQFGVRASRHHFTVRKDIDICLHNAFGAFSTKPTQPY
jgi:hypothetical protein